MNSMGKCPLCNEEQIESKLRKNLILDEIVIFFKRYRPDLIELLAAQPPLPEMEKSDTTEVVETINLDSDEETDSSKRSSRSALDLKRPPSIDSLLSSPRKKLRSVGARDLSTEELSECPICHDLLPLNEIQTTHIDQCLSTNSDPKPAIKPPKSSHTLSSFFLKKSKEPKRAFSFDKSKQFQLQHNSQNTKTLKKLNFSSLNTTKLKEKLSQLSLPTTGSRQQLETRYNHYMILYNSNLDSVNPAPLKKLRADLNQWEFLNNNMDSDLQVTSIQKNVDRNSWVESHNDEFKKLIMKLRSKSNDSKEKTEDPVVITSTQTDSTDPAPESPSLTTENEGSEK